MAPQQRRADPTSPDGRADHGAELIVRNRLLLALAEEARATARDTIERAQDAVLSMMEIRLAWAQVRHLWRTRRDLP